MCFIYASRFINIGMAICLSHDFYGLYHAFYWPSDMFEIRALFFFYFLCGFFSIFSCGLWAGPFFLFVGPTVC